MIRSVALLHAIRFLKRQMEPLLGLISYDNFMNSCMQITYTSKHDIGVLGTYQMEHQVFSDKVV